MCRIQGADLRAPETTPFPLLEHSPDGSIYCMTIKASARVYQTLADLLGADPEALIARQ